MKTLLSFILCFFLVFNIFAKENNHISDELSDSEKMYFNSYIEGASYAYQDLIIDSNFKLSEHKKREVVRELMRNDLSDIFEKNHFNILNKKNTKLNNREILKKSLQEKYLEANQALWVINSVTPKIIYSTYEQRYKKSNKVVFNCTASNKFDQKFRDEFQKKCELEKERYSIEAASKNLNKLTNASNEAIEKLKSVRSEYMKKIDHEHTLTHSFPGYRQLRKNEKDFFDNSYLDIKKRARECLSDSIESLSPYDGVMRTVGGFEPVFFAVEGNISRAIGEAANINRKSVANNLNKKIATIRKNLLNEITKIEKLVQKLENLSENEVQEELELLFSVSPSIAGKYSLLASKKSNIESIVKNSSKKFDSKNSYYDILSSALSIAAVLSSPFPVVSIPLALTAGTVQSLQYFENVDVIKKSEISIVNKAYLDYENDLREKALSRKATIEKDIYLNLAAVALPGLDIAEVTDLTKISRGFNKSIDLVKNALNIGKSIKSAESLNTLYSSDLVRAEISDRLIHSEKANLDSIRILTLSTLSDLTINEEKSKTLWAVIKSDKTTTENYIQISNLLIFTDLTIKDRSEMILEIIERNKNDYSFLINLVEKMSGEQIQLDNISIIVKKLLDIEILDSDLLLKVLDLVESYLESVESLDEILLKTNKYKDNIKIIEKQVRIAFKSRNKINHFDKYFNENLKMNLVGKNFLWLLAKEIGRDKTLAKDEFERFLWIVLNHPSSDDEVISAFVFNHFEDKNKRYVREHHRDIIHFHKVSAESVRRILESEANFDSSASNLYSFVNEITNSPHATDSVLSEIGLSALYSGFYKQDYSEILMTLLKSEKSGTKTIAAVLEVISKSNNSISNTEELVTTILERSDLSYGLIANLANTIAVSKQSISDYSTVFSKLIDYAYKDRNSDEKSGLSIYLTYAFLIKQDLVDDKISIRNRIKGLSVDNSLSARGTLLAMQKTGEQIDNANKILMEIASKKPYLANEVVRTIARFKNPVSNTSQILKKIIHSKDIFNEENFFHMHMYNLSLTNYPIEGMDNLLFDIIELRDSRSINHMVLDIIKDSKFPIENSSQLLQKIINRASNDTHTIFKVIESILESNHPVENQYELIFQIINSESLNDENAYEILKSIESFNIQENEKHKLKEMINQKIYQIKVKEYSAQ